MIRKVYVDLGGWKGDTLALYGAYFLEDEAFPHDQGSPTSYDKAAFVFETDALNIQVILDKYNGNFDGDSMRRVGDNLLHKMKPYVHLIHGAAYNVDTILSFESSGGNTNAGKIARTGDATVLAYDAGSWFMKWVQPTESDIIIVKIDIEGSEVEVIDSFHASGAFHFIDHVVVEWHDWNSPAVKAAKPRLEAILASYGLIYQWATLDDTLWRRYGAREEWPVNHCDAHYFRSGDERWNFKQK
jgi:hypothetical protein